MVGTSIHLSNDIEIMIASQTFKMVERTNKEETIPHTSLLEQAHECYNLWIYKEREADWMPSDLQL